MTLAECQERVSAAEFLEWQVWFRREPPLAILLDLLTAQVCQMLAAKSAPLGDFLLLEHETQQQTSAQMMAIASTFAASRRRCDDAWG